MFGIKLDNIIIGANKIHVNILIFHRGRFHQREDRFRDKQKLPSMKMQPRWQEVANNRKVNANNKERRQEAPLDNISRPREDRNALTWRKPKIREKTQEFNFEVPEE